jgi:hypothetical protein
VQPSYKVDTSLNELYLDLHNYSDVNYIRYVSLTEKLYTNKIDTPKLFTDLKLWGNVSISMSFENSPRVSMTLECDRGAYDDVYKYFTKEDRKITLFNIPYRVSYINYQSNPRVINPKGRFVFNISLDSYWTKGLNTQIYLLNKNDKTCSYNNVEVVNFSESKKDKDKYEVSLSKLARKADVKYKGLNHKIEVDKQNTKASSTFNNLLQAESRKNKSFVYIGKSVELRDWDRVSKHKLDDTTVIEDTGVSYSKQGVQIKYDPYLLTWNNSEEDFTDTKGIPRFVKKNPKTKTEYSGDETYNSPPSIEGVIKTLDLTFDNSGPRKQRIKTTYEIGFKGEKNILFEEISTYGFEYVSKDHIVVNGDEAKFEINGPGSVWRQIEYQQTEYIYDKFTGYYLGNNITGWKRCRFKAETNALETWVYQQELAELEPEDEDAAEIQAFLNTYLYRTVSVRGYTRYKLGQLRDYFNSYRHLLPYITFYYCDSQGNLQLGSVRDPNYIEPMFMLAEETIYSCFDKIENPENIALRREIEEQAAANDPDADPITLLPPLTVGKDTQIRRRVQVSGDNSVLYQFDDVTNGEGRVQTDLSIKPDIKEYSYTTFTTEYSAQDDGFRNSSENTQTEISSGEPGQHKAKPLYFYNKDEISKDSSQHTSGNRTRKKDDIEYLIYTDSFTDKDPVKGVISFDVDTKQKAFAAAETDLRIKRTLQEESLNLTTFFSLDYEIGDRLIVKYNDITYKCRILNINHNISILGYNLDFKNIESVANTQLTLGVESFVNLKIKERKIPKPNNIFQLVNVKYNDKILQATPFNIDKSRYKF